MVYTQDLILDINSNMAYTVVGAKQGDRDSRVINVHITENGTDYNLVQQGVTQAQFRFKKPDGKSIINQATIIENVIQIVLTAQALAVAGRGYADIVLLSDQSVLSTVSFIINIMSSPSVTGDAISTDEFGYLNSIVADSVQIMYEAQAWAVGSRGEAAVFSREEFSAKESSIVISSLTVDSATFKQKVGNYYGTTRTFVFAYNSNGNWDLNTTIQNGNNTLVDNSIVIGSLGDYGISYSPNNILPDVGDTITAIWSQADYTHNNNAKYWSDISKTYKDYISEATASATPLDSSSAYASIIEVAASGSTPSHFQFEFGLPRGLTGRAAEISSVTASASGINYDQNPQVTVTTTSDGNGNYSFDFDFLIPGGVGGVGQVDGVYPSNGAVILDAVSFGRNQVLDSMQQLQARNNIGAMASDDIIALSINDIDSWFV